jgi:SagB-type dehydrogenase family enzyme
MNNQKEQLNFFAQFFNETDILEWEGESLTVDGGQQLKAYPRMPRYKLPEPTLPIDTSLSGALLGRYSAQQLSTEKFTLSDISTILAAIGTRPSSKIHGFNRRTYPSAGAKYPGETYIIVLNCDELIPGVYHYAMKEHELEGLWKEDLRESLVATTNDQRILAASIVLVFSVVYGRIAEKYGKRGLRYCLIELGHMAQNISLVANAIHKGCYDMGGFIDSKVNNWLDINNESETAALLMVLGGKTCNEGDDSKEI